MPNYRQNKPEADVLMNSMRSMGYTFEAAISDIIDNSISADAHNIQLIFFPLTHLIASLQYVTMDMVWIQMICSGQ